MLYEMMCQKLNLNHKAKYREFRDGDIRHSLADISKIKNQLGYQPEYIVDTGLSLTVNYFQYTHQQDIKIMRMHT
jgi:nucleoside-diphosphate-sugar epimerase